MPCSAPLLTLCPTQHWARASSTSHWALPLCSCHIPTPLGLIWVSHLVPWTTLINPVLKPEASQIVSSQAWSKMSLPCSPGVAVWDSSTEHKWARQLHQHQTQGFLTFPMPLLLDFSHHSPSFLSARKEDPWAASQQIYSANRAPSAVCDCLKLQENTTTTIKTEGNPSSSSSRLHQLTLHDILTHHFAAHCLI